MKTIPSRFTIQFFVFLGLLAMLLTSLLVKMNDVRLQQAEDSYHKGEAAKTISERKEGFNEALELFLKLDAEYLPHFGTGRLDYNIGNTYFQLEEYPLAILYYKKAENLMPRSELVKRNLSQAENKIGLHEENKHGILDTLLLKPYLSLPERLQLFFIFSLFTLIFTSAWLWTKNQWFSKSAVLFLIPAFLLLLNLTFSYYFSPVHGVLIQSAELRRDAGMQFAKVSEQPILAGTTLEVTGTSMNGRWLRVVLPNGEFGFVPIESLKLIER
jgi:tetratricopeptide (TPR) repeat protein